MDNLAHSLVGLAAAKAGLERLSPGATLVCVLAANTPDGDIAVLLFADRWSFLHYHRHITHSIVGTLAIALIIPLIFWCGDRLIARMRSRSPSVRLKGLLLASLVVSATHPLLDWTNNYGVRLLLPWSSQWFYGDLVFIVDPFIWLVLGGAVFLLGSRYKWQIGIWLIAAIALTYLVMTATTQREVTNAFLLCVFWVVSITGLVLAYKLGAAERWGRKIAWSAFGLLLAYWMGLFVMHSVALSEVRRAASTIAIQHNEGVTDVAAMPTLANPFHWQGVVETDRAAYRFEISLPAATPDLSALIRHERADTFESPFVVRAAEDRRARIFLGFARFPVFRVRGADCMTETIVQMADLRYTEPGSSRGSFALEVPIDCPIETGMKSTE
ncbi:MAG: metal-dependent hydrolase [Pyrinomonadaceae bacterium]